LNFMADYRHYGSQKHFELYDDQGQQIPSQRHGGHSVVLENTNWNPYLAFIADMPPLTVRRYELRPETPAPLAADQVTVEDDATGIKVESKFWTAQFSRNKAALVALVERATGRNLLKAPVQLFAMQDVAHAWGGMDNAIYNVP